MSAQINSLLGVTTGGSRTPVELSGDEVTSFTDGDDELRAKRPSSATRRAWIAGENVAVGSVRVSKASVEDDWWDEDL